MTKTINIGVFGEEPRQLEVEDNATVSSALNLAGLSLQNTQSVSAFSNAETVGLSENVVNGETYLLTANHTSGRK